MFINIFSLNLLCFNEIGFVYGEEMIVFFITGNTLDIGEVTCIQLEDIN